MKPETEPRHRRTPACGDTEPVVAPPDASEHRLDTSSGGPEPAIPTQVIAFRLSVASGARGNGIPNQQSHRHYTGKSGRRYHRDRHGVPEEAYLWVARQRAKKFMPVIESESTVLEYGVGTGWDLAMLECRRRLGYDIADFLAPQVRAHGIDFVADTKSLDDGTVDVAICHHVLEHLLEPSSALGEMRRLLRPGGTLWLSVPYEIRSFARKFNSADPHHHLFSWNVQTLANLAQEVGFRVEQASLGRFGYDRFAAITSFRLHLGEPGYKLIRAALHALRPVREVRLIAKAEKETEDHVTG